jgi:formylglycine-generating enzyme required for sulfatase activity
MKRLIISIYTAVLGAALFAGCSGGGGGDKKSTSGKENYTADGVSFAMCHVPGGTFPIGANDVGSATVSPFWIAETEVTYELWYKVRVWATTDVGGGKRADGGVLYTLSDQGCEGSNGSAGLTPTTAKNEPVTHVNIYDSMVWCNALTEWYNAKNGTNYGCVYSRTGTIVRDSSGYGTWVADANANGFRLPTSEEWECAARYIDGTVWLYGDHASGDLTGACYNDGSILGGLALSALFGNYAVYDSNSGGKTAQVKSKLPNALGVYDMSGNVMEWCFFISYYGYLKGGCWSFDSSYLRVGSTYSDYLDYEDDFTSLRFARTK